LIKKAVPETPSKARPKAHLPHVCAAATAAVPVAGAQLPPPQLAAVDGVERLWVKPQDVLRAGLKKQTER
jgi:phosphoribosylcarboxyaminoimidazole (NCAIR) mutase